MKVREVMKSPAVWISVDATYEDAAQVMHSNRFSGLPVLDRDGSLAGVVSEKDLFKALYPDYEEFSRDPVQCLDQEQREEEIVDLRRTPVSRYMTKRVITIDPDSPVLKAGGLMLAKGIHRLPVVERGKLVGIVTRREIYGAILQRRLDQAPAEPLKRAQNA